MWVGSISIGTVWKSSVSSPSSPSGISIVSSVQEVGISFSLSFGISGSYESEKNDLEKELKLRSICDGINNFRIQFY